MTDNERQGVHDLAVWLSTLDSHSIYGRDELFGTIASDHVRVLYGSGGIVILRVGESRSARIWSNTRAELNARRGELKGPTLYDDGPADEHFVSGWVVAECLCDVTGERPYDQFHGRGTRFRAALRHLQEVGGVEPKTDL